MHRLLRGLTLALWAAVLLAVFVAASYFSFNAFVRRGEVTVPSLAGLSLEEGSAALADVGVVMRHREDKDRFDDETPPGAIVEQTPRAGTPIKRGGEVVVALSRGRERVRVPDLVDQPMRTVLLDLRAAGLTLGRSFQVYTAHGLEGRVVRHEPPAGVEVDPMSPVDLYVRLAEAGESFVMPDLIYRDYAAVRRFFEAQGFRVGSVKFEAYEGAAPGSVLRQYPLPGHRLDRQDVISLVVTAGEARRPAGAGADSGPRRLRLDNSALGTQIAPEPGR
ncbi:MAG: PASTA domain-containing protein [Thermoanaerobaculia bacterium]|nr:PASTA domain-containing protein [Thermoanaerobaculia bacterium]